MRLAVLLLLSLSSACAVRPAYNAYFAFPIKDPKFIERVQALHQAALDVSKEFAPLLVPIEKLQQKMLSFRLDKDEESRDLVNEKTMAELCKILPRRVAYSTFSFAQRSLGNSVVAQSQSYGLALHISTQLLGILDRNGLAYEQKSVPYGTTPYAVLIEGSNKLNVTDIPIGGLELFASAYVDTIYVCRENSASANNFCDVIQEITLKCEEKKKNVCRNAMAVSICD